MSMRSGLGGQGKRTNTREGVSAGRLRQKSGIVNSFGGYTKVNRGDGTFSMKRTGRGDR